jgi:hypothetical protein
VLAASDLLTCSGLVAQRNIRGSSTASHLPAIYFRIQDNSSIRSTSRHINRSGGNRRWAPNIASLSEAAYRARFSLSVEVLNSSSNRYTARMILHRFSNDVDYQPPNLQTAFRGLTNEGSGRVVGKPEVIHVEPISNDKFECIGQGRSAWCRKAELSGR